MSAVRIVMVLWGGLFLVLAPLQRPGDGDLWWQRWLGEMILRTHQLPTTLGPETFTSAGVPWVPQEWFLSLLVALAMRDGLFAVLTLFVAAIPIGVLFSVYARSRDRAGPIPIAIVLLFVGVSLASSFGVRAQVLGWGCFAAFLCFLQRKDAWRFGAVVVVVIWANVHASVMIAPVFIVARIVGQVADGGVRGLKSSKELQILLLVAIGLFCTPLGWHLPAYATTLALSPIRHYIEEWQPAALNESAFLFGALPLAILVAISGIRIAARNKAESLPISLLFAGMLLARRNEALFAIAAAPLAARSLDFRFPRLKEVAGRIAGLERFAIVATCIAFAASGSLFFLANRDAPPKVPTAAIALLAAGGTAQRLFCEDFSDCSIALQYPNLQVFMDGRCDPFPVDVWRSYISTIRVEPGWESTLQRYRIGAVVAPRESPLGKAMASKKAWRTAFSDDEFVLYKRT